MAYPTVSVPYGFKPVNLLGGQVYAGAVRQYPIGASHATAIYYGDVVSMTAAGTVWNAANTDSAGTTLPIIGIFQGCSYINAQGQRIYSQYYPAAASAGAADTPNQITAYVADDPDLVMKVVVATNSTTVLQSTRGFIGSNAVWVATAGNATTGNSYQSMLTAAATTTTWPLKVIDVVPETAAASGSFVEYLVTWNAGVHMYRNTAGV
jgi:hypothetical protein